MSALNPKAATFVGPKAVSFVGALSATAVRLPSVGGRGGRGGGRGHGASAPVADIEEMPDSTAGDASAVVEDETVIESTVIEESPLLDAAEVEDPGSEC